MPPKKSATGGGAKKSATNDKDKKSGGAKGKKPSNDTGDAEKSKARLFISVSKLSDLRLLKVFNLYSVDLSLFNPATLSLSLA